VGAVSALITARSGGGRAPEGASPGFRAIPFWQTGLQGNTVGLRFSW